MNTKIINKIIVKKIKSIDRHPSFRNTLLTGSFNYFRYSCPSPPSPPHRVPFFLRDSVSGICRRIYWILVLIFSREKKSQWNRGCVSIRREFVTFAWNTRHDSGGFVRFCAVRIREEIIALLWSGENFPPGKEVNEISVWKSIFRPFYRSTRIYRALPNAKHKKHNTFESHRYFSGAFLKYHRDFFSWMGVHKRYSACRRPAKISAEVMEIIKLYIFFLTCVHDSRG